MSNTEKIVKKFQQCSLLSIHLVPTKLENDPTQLFSLVWWLLSPKINLRCNRIRRRKKSPKIFSLGKSNAFLPSYKKSKSSNKKCRSSYIKLMNILKLIKECFRALNSMTFLNCMRKSKIWINFFPKIDQKQIKAFK